MPQHVHPLEEHWRAIFQHVASEHDRQKLAELVVRVNHLLDSIEERMTTLDGTNPED
jgi:hypothetical protein